MRRPLLVVLLIASAAGRADAQFVTVVAASSSSTATVAAPGGGNYAVTTSATSEGNRTFSPDGPVVGPSGHVVYSARLAGTTGASGLFVSGAGASAATRLAVQGGVGPDAGATYNALLSGSQELAVNAAGQVAVQTVLFPGGTSGYGAVLRFAAGGGPATVVARDDEAAPGGGFFSGTYNAPIAMNAAGRVGFAAATDTADGFFTGTGTAGAAVALVGAAAPGGGTFEGLNSFSRTMAADGSVAFSAYMDADGEIEGLFVGNGTTAVQLARIGVAAPFIGGGNYDGFKLRDGAPAINAAGQAAFTATADTGNVGVFRRTGGTTAALAQVNDAAPGTGGGTFNNFEPVMGLSAAGKAAFVAGVQGGTTNRGVFTADGTTVRAVAVGGQAAPGLSGLTFGTAGDSIANLPEDGVRINDAGGVAFWARLTGTGVTTANDSSLWYENGTGGYLLLAREGQAVTVGPGDVRTLGQLPQTFDMSDAGIAYLGTFTNGSQAILFVNFVPVPESNAALGVAAAGLLAGFRFRRPR